MVKPKLLIVGDSFSSDNTADSWTAQLEYNITNISSCGSSEYRILQKLETADLEQYEKVLVVHTSANRIYVEHNPLHQHDTQYQQCDLIYNDVKNSSQQDTYTKSVVWWFENCWDQNQANYIHSLLINRAKELTMEKGVHITFFDYTLPAVANLHAHWKNHPGKINHMDIAGNKNVAQILKKYL